MTPAEEDAYELGGKSAWRQMLALALRNLGIDAPDGARLAMERAETVAMLRRVCSRHGDNEWPDDLHLSDVIEKHLGRHLPETAE